MTQNISRTFYAFFFLVFAFSAVSFAQTSPSKIGNVEIKNFGQMDDNYYRGGQAKEDQYEALKEIGITTVIDLRDDPTDYEKPTVESLGMRYINIPMEDDEYPTEENINKFLQLMNDPATGKVFVHCKGGKHRAGVTAAAYRISKYGWDYDRAYQEMKNYDFHTRWGRGVMKDFVKDYAKRSSAAKKADFAATSPTNSHDQ